MASLWIELKRRNVFKVGIAYLLYLTRLLRRPPPEMRLEEGEGA